MKELEISSKGMNATIIPTWSQNFHMDGQMDWMDNGKSKWPPSHFIYLSSYDVKPPLEDIDVLHVRIKKRKFYSKKNKKYRSKTVKNKYNLVT